MRKFSLEIGEISYLVEGEGAQGFLLVHNSGGSHEMMSHTTAHFSKKGRVIVPDLLGHSLSDSPKMEYTLTVFAESLIQLCKHEKMKRVILIGLNYGANIGIEIAKMVPELVSHLILIEPPIFMEPWIVKVVEQQIQELVNPRENWAQESVDSTIVKVAELERGIALKALKATPHFVKISTYKHLLAWDKEHVFNCLIPTLMIQGSKPFCAEEKARTVFSHLQVGRVVGSGPWLNLEVPTQVHSMIDRFLDLMSAWSKQ